MDIGNRLRQIREAKGLSQGDIEERTGLLRAYISRVECGFTVPQLQNLKKWADALDVTLSEIFSGHPVTPTPARRAPLSEFEERLLGVARRLDERDKRLLLSIGNKMLRQQSRRGKIGTGRTRRPRNP
jgi:transcriptional regulator with XRE-family HTH domain